MDLHIASEAKTDDHTWLQKNKFMRMVKYISKPVGSGRVSDEPLYDLGVLLLLLEEALLWIFDNFFCGC